MRDLLPSPAVQGKGEDEEDETRENGYCTQASQNHLWTPRSCKSGANSKWGNEAPYADCCVYQVERRPSRDWKEISDEYILLQR